MQIVPRWHWWSLALMILRCTWAFWLREQSGVIYCHLAIIVLNIHGHIDTLVENSTQLNSLTSSVLAWDPAFEVDITVSLRLHKAVLSHISDPFRIWESPSWVLVSTRSKSSEKVSSGSSLLVLVGAQSVANGISPTVSDPCYANLQSHVEITFENTEQNFFAQKSEKFI